MINLHEFYLCISYVLVLGFCLMTLLTYSSVSAWLQLIFHIFSNGFAEGSVNWE